LYHAEYGLRYRTLARRTPGAPPICGLRSGPPERKGSENPAGEPSRAPAARGWDSGERQRDWQRLALGQKPEGAAPVTTPSRLPLLLEFPKVLLSTRATPCRRPKHHKVQAYPFVMEIPTGTSRRQIA